MQNSLKCLAILISVFLCFSCSSSSSENDSNSAPDADADTQDSETIDEDADLQDSDFIDDSDVLPDADADQDTDSEDEDWHRDIDIPEMSDDPYFETYGDADFNVAYYYYGDEPTPAHDPENVKALWSKLCGSSKCLECEPCPYDLCAENYPFEPQIIGGNGVGKHKSTAGQFQCDALLTPGFWYTDDLAVSMQFNEFDGRILYEMTVKEKYSWQNSGTYVYDLNTRKVKNIGRAYMDGWQNKRYYFISTFDYRVETSDKNSPYYGRNEKHLLYYDNETNTYGRAFKMPENTTYIVDVRANENYIFISAHFADNASDMRIMYTKIGEWDKWKELTYKKGTLYGNDRRAGYPSMIGSLVTYFDYDIQVQVCDLDIGDSSCFQVSRADEYGRYPIFKDKNTVIYSAQKIDGSANNIVSADISDRKNIKYSELYKGGSAAIGSYDVDDEGKYLLIKRRYANPTNSEKEIHDYCIYRFSDKTTVCFDEAFDLEIDKNEGFIYQNKLIFRSVQDLVIRDLECYCDFYPNKCPLIEYKPNPENPKKPWGFDWKPENLRDVNNKKEGERK